MKHITQHQEDLDSKNLVINLKERYVIQIRVCRTRESYYNEILKEESINYEKTEYIAVLKK